MKNANWRRIGYVALAIIIIGIAYGAGYVIGEMDAAKFFIKKGVEMGIFTDITETTLIDYYFKLKGGGC